MKHVWKYPLHPGNNTLPGIPLNAKVVFVEAQGVQPFVWLEITEHTTHIKDRKFLVAATGDDVPDTAWHVGSCTDGILVWHVYELQTA